MNKFYNILIFIGLVINIHAQDISFSHFNLFQTYYNPGMSGAFDGNVKVSLINRDHWVKYSESPYRSFGITGDIKFNLTKEGSRGDYLTLGAYFLSDRAQILDWNKNEMGLSVSFYKNINKAKKTLLSGGVGIGLLQRSLSYDNIYFQDQFDGLNRYSNPTSEILPVNIHTTPDIKIGVALRTMLNNSWNMNIGTGLHYIFSPNFSFYKNLDNINYRGNDQYSALLRTNTSLNFIYHINKFEQIIPKVFLATQGIQTLGQLATIYRRSFYNFNQTAFQTGAALRVASSDRGMRLTDLGLILGFEIKNFSIGLQYDFGLSDAIKFGSATHSFELGISWIGNYDNDGYICPKF